MVWSPEETVLGRSSENLLIRYWSLHVHILCSIHASNGSEFFGHRREDTEFFENFLEEFGGGGEGGKKTLLNILETFKERRGETLRSSSKWFGHRPRKLGDVGSNPTSSDIFFAYFLSKYLHKKL